jgi:acyl-coenzyme A synthetase/AMP-(fatty) acid ligase
VAKRKGFYIGLMFDEAAAVHGGAPVVLDRPLQCAPAEGTRLTVGRLAGLVRETATRLSAAGVRRGERVAIYKTDNFDIAVLASAVQRIGAVPALLSPALDGTTVNRLLERLERPWLLTDREKIDAVPELDLGGAWQVLVSAGPAPEGTVELAGLPATPHVAPSVVDVHEPAFISHTSGTTGLPKLVVQSPDALGNRLRFQKAVAGRMWRREPLALCVSFVHARFYSALNIGISFGNKLLVAVDASPQNIGPLFAEHRPGVVETQPNTFVDWESLVDAAGSPLAGVKCYSATFDAMHPRTVRVLLGASKRRRPMFFQLYGQSETGPVTGNAVTLARAGKADGRCVGWALPGTIRLRVVDGAGRPVKAGEVGYIEISSRTLALTYLGEAERFAGQLRGGWWRMGDVGFKDRLGRVHLLDREIDKIDSIDSNLEVEDELMGALPELREIVIVAGPDGRALPVVCTRDDSPLDEDRWRTATAAMPPMAPPRQIAFDLLPRTATWKIRRPELMRMLEQEEAQIRA